MELSFVILTAITVGVVEIIKKLMKENRFVPLVALAVGVALAFLGQAYTGASAWQDSVLYGLVMGLSAMGLYSGGKSLLEQ
ncbi:MAG: hypothetical protein SOW48_01100 [Peptoniphilaceae bacterium]|nr:hypothetical protein [Peptoniphilaceae bacterium]MDD7434638.1 hypothetical protein [Peptoniphilaceae bacterium]MDY3075249.1 hypothetical protein [Peptoniphilaceae bacterium]MDY3987065.1 hypothetical protein [Peptoniphilaceae bacterium]MDY4197027.1 hypothetical protein [Peptoniphilaceae bacterium]